MHSRDPSKVWIHYNRIKRCKNAIKLLAGFWMRNQHLQFAVRIAQWTSSASRLSCGTKLNIFQPSKVTFRKTNKITQHLSGDSIAVSGFVRFPSIETSSWYPSSRGFSNDSSITSRMFHVKMSQEACQCLMPYFTFSRGYVLTLSLKCKLHRVSPAIFYVAWQAPATTILILVLFLTFVVPLRKPYHPSVCNRSYKYIGSTFLPPYLPRKA
jgi:hypothetical protein